MAFPINLSWHHHCQPKQQGTAESLGSTYFDTPDLVTRSMNAGSSISSLFHNVVDGCFPSEAKEGEL